MEHENWWLAFKSFQNQFRDQLYSWQRDRDDLFIKIKAVFAEANSEHEAEIERVADRQKQAHTCEELHQKVRNLGGRRKFLINHELAKGQPHSPLVLIIFCRCKNL